MSIEAARLFVKVGGDTAEGEAALRRFSTTLQNTAKQAGVTGTILSAALTAPLLGLGKKALGVATDFQSSMNMFQAVSGATAEQMKAVDQLAVALGADMSLPATSAADAATAMTELAKAGLSVDDSLSAARGVLQLSAAGAISNARAAEIAANALNMFHLKGSEAVRVADLLAAAANASSGEVTDMADSLAMAGSVFASGNQTIQDTVTAISLMANAGIKGSDAGTSLKQMMLSLEAPSNKARGIMEGLGIQIYDASGNMLDMRSIVGNLNTSMQHMTQEQRNAALAIIFGSDAVRAANILMDAGVDGWDKMSGAVNKGGAASDLAGVRMKGLKGALQGLQSQLETTALTLSRRFLGPAEGLVRWVAGLVGSIPNLSGKLLNVALAVLAVAAAIGPALLLISGTAAALAFLTSPLGLVFAGIAALAGLLAGSNRAWTLLRDSILTVKQALEGKWTDAPNVRSLHRILGSLANIARELFDSFSLLKNGNFDQFIDRMTGAWDRNKASLKSAGLTLLNELIGPLKGLGLLLGGAAIGLGLSILNWVLSEIRTTDWSAVGGVVLSKIAGALSTLGGAALAVGGAGLSLGSQIVGWVWNQLQNTDWSSVAGAVMDGIGRGLSAAGGVALSAGAGAVSLGGQLVTWVWNQLQGVDWSSVAGAITGGIGTALSTIGTAAVGVGMGAVGIGQTVVSWVWGQLQGVDWSSVGSTITGGISTAVSAIGVAGAAVGAGAISIGTTIVNWINTQLQTTDWSAIGATIQSKIAGAMTAIGGQQGGEKANSAFSWIADSALPALSSLGALIQQYVVPQLQGLGEAVVTAEGNFLNRLAPALDTVKPMLGDLQGIAGDLAAILGPAAGGLAFSVGLLATAMSEAAQVEIPVFGSVLGTLAAGAVLVLASNISLLRQNLDILVEGFHIVRDAIGSFIDGLVRSEKAAIDTARNIASGVKGAFTSLPGEMKSIGSDIVQGLIDGLRSGVGAVKDAVGDIVGSLGPLARFILDSKSPSKVFIKIGQDVVDGLAIGLDDSAPVEKSAKQLASAAASAAKAQAKREAQDIVNEWQGMFNALPDLIAGNGIQGLQQQLDKLTLAFQVATGLGAPQEVIDNLAKQIADVSDQIDQIVAAASLDAVKAAQQAVQEAAQQKALEDAWTKVLADPIALASGKAAQQAREAVDKLQASLAIATAAGAPDAVIVALQNSLGAATAELERIGAIMADPIVKGMADGIARQTAVSDFWKLALDPKGLESGDLAKKLAGEIANLKQQIALATVGGAPQDIIDQLKHDLTTKQDQLAGLGVLIDQGIAAGILKGAGADKLSAAVLAQLAGISGSLGDQANQLVKPILDAVMAGTLSVADAAGLLPGDALDALQNLEQSLTVDLANALLSGADNVDELNRKLGALAALMDLVSKKSRLKGPLVTEATIVGPEGIASVSANYLASQQAARPSRPSDLGVASTTASTATEPGDARNQGGSVEVIEKQPISIDLVLNESTLETIVTEVLRRSQRKVLGS